jgi:hypothetical protein
MIRVTGQTLPSSERKKGQEITSHAFAAISSSEAADRGDSTYPHGFFHWGPLGVF